MIKDYCREDLCYYSDISAVAGIRDYIINSGPGKGVRAIEVYTGSGLAFTVLPDRGMDISRMEFKGTPVSWVCKSGVFAPSFFSQGKWDFIRMMFGGLLTTCGLIQAGSPCSELSAIYGEMEYGLHGQVNLIPAENVNIHKYFDGDQYILKIEGKTRQACLYGENLVLTREVTTNLGSNTVKISDTLTNEGFERTQYMLLYHINFGYPILSPDSRLHTNFEKVTPLNDFARLEGKSPIKFSEPKQNYLPDNFRFEDIRSEYVHVLLINEAIGIGIRLSYLQSQLPYFTEWINLAPQDYVIGFEPGKCLPEGRADSRKNNRAVYLNAGESIAAGFEIEVIQGQKELESKKELLLKEGK